MQISITEYQDTGDSRGSSFPLNEELTAFLSEARGCHISTILPCQIRGNHYHEKQKEILFIMKGCAWTLWWDEGDKPSIQRRDFSGNEAIVVRIPPGVSHALVNGGDVPLLVVGLADQKYDPSNPDAFGRRVAP